MGIWGTLSLLAAFVIFSGCLAALLVKYGKKIQESESKDAVLKKTLEMHKTTSEVAVNQPVTDDDVLARLSKPN